MFDLEVQGGSKVTKEYLSETFRNSIILKGPEERLFFFHKGWGFILFCLRDSINLGLREGGGGEFGNESVSFRNVPKQFYSIRLGFYDVRFMK